MNGWLEREERRGYIVGQFWYLVAMDWWKTWNEYVSMPYPSGNVSEVSNQDDTACIGFFLKAICCCVRSS